MYFAGGYSFTGGGAQKEILAFDGENWTEVGQLKEPRYDHAATVIDITDFMGFCN